MPLWEYKTIARPANEPLADEQLNQLGAAGFELVHVTVVTDHVTVVGRHETRNTVHYFFKRPRPQQAPQPKSG